MPRCARRQKLEGAAPDTARNVSGVARWLLEFQLPEVAGGIPIRNLPFSIGSSSQADLVLRGNELKGQHCELRRSAGGDIEIVARAGGVFVDGEELLSTIPPEPKRLREGAQVEIVLRGKHISFVVRGFGANAATESASVAGSGPCEDRVGGTSSDLPNSSDATSSDGLEASLQCLVCMSMMHRCVSLYPCLHSLCAGCATRVLESSGRCPACRVDIDDVRPNLAMRGVVDFMCQARPGQKRKLEELEELDSVERRLAARLEERRGAVARRSGVVSGDPFAWFRERQEAIGAVEDGDANVLRGVLERSDAAVARAVLSDGRPLLCTAAALGHHSTVQVLLEHGAGVEVMSDDGRTPLTLAAEAGHDFVMAVLLNVTLGANGQTFWGANPDRCDESGISPLCYAATGGHVEAVRQLLVCRMSTRAYGPADVDLASEGEGWAPPLYLAAEMGHREVAEVLLAHGADPNGAKRGSNGAPADRQVTPLCIAAQEGHADMVRVLLAGGAEPDRARGDGVVPLYIAVQNGHHAAVRALLAAGASARSCAVGGFSALYLASQEGDTEMVRELARAGAAVDERQPDGLVPLAAAVRNGHREAEAALMQAGADPALAWCSWEDRLRSPLRAAAARLGALVSLLTT